ncbi:MAG TPA: DUF6585 family protein [Ktedonobacteraceae bacterium]|nr:DUF6585 family protein [Ktedonobacteraceae bacterium]
MVTNMMPQEPLPLPVQQVAATQQLGALVKVYKASIIGSIVGFLLFLIGGVFFLFGGLFAEDTTDNTKTVLVLCGVACLALAVYLVALVIQAVSRRTYLFQQGLVIYKGNQVQSLPWNQVAEVWQSITRNYRNGIYTGTTYLYTLRRADGTQIRLNNMTKGVAELGPAVARGVSQELIPRALSALRSGQTLTFTPFSVNQQGLGNGREFVPWSQIQSIDVNKGVITVKKFGQSRRWASAMVSKVPNFLVFTVVAEEMRRQAGVVR